MDSIATAFYVMTKYSSASQVEGIQGIMTAYMSALFNVSLAGPTLFGRVISTAANIASQALADGQQKYYVLLIITVRCIILEPFFIGDTGSFLPGLGILNSVCTFHIDIISSYFAL